MNCNSTCDSTGQGNGRKHNGGTCDSTGRGQGRGRNMQNIQGNLDLKVFPNPAEQSAKIQMNLKEKMTSYIRKRRTYQKSLRTEKNLQK